MTTYLSRYISCQKCNKPATLTLNINDKVNAYLCDECAKELYPNLYDLKDMHGE